MLKTHPVTKGILWVVATLVATVYLFYVVPKGFFPVQDTGVIQGITEAPQSISFGAMAERQQALVEVVVYSLGNDVIIDVLDEGKGVQAADLPRLFDPFFTTDTQGTGLGLYLSQAFTEANHARLLCVPEHKKTCFRLIIPQRQFVATDLNSTTLPNTT